MAAVAAAMFSRSALAASALALTALGACSASPDAADNTASATAPANDIAMPTPPEPIVNAAEPTPTASAPPAAAANVLALEGLGDLRIGEPVPAGSSWKERGAQTGPECRTVSSPDFPGAYAIVTDNKVQRITLGERSDVKLAEGIGVGATEADVNKWFAGFRAEPHKYEAAPAKYLTAPNAAGGSSALRFEIGADRKVRLIHVGLMPVLGYVEGCA